MTPSKRAAGLEPPPLFRARDLVRLASLLVIMAFLVALIFRTRDPKTWRWLGLFDRQDTPAQSSQTRMHKPLPSPEQQELQFHAGQAVGCLGLFGGFSSPAALAAGVPAVQAQEQVPFDYQSTLPAATRRAPLPDMRILDGAQDREGFLIERPGGLINDFHRLDADARYHLMELAKAAQPEDLAADARQDIRYSVLRDKPDEYRGDVIHVEGELIWIKTFELNRQVPSVPFVYQGLIHAGRPDHGFLVFFLELPKSFPPEAQWGQLYLRDVRFNGYFLKTLREENPRDRSRPWLLPVLVGKNLELAPAPASDGLGSFLLPLALVLVVIALAAATVIWFLRRGDHRHEARMSAVRRRRLDGPAEEESPPPSRPPGFDWRNEEV
jgi:hypothetical protein